MRNPRRVLFPNPGLPSQWPLQGRETSHHGTSAGFQKAAQEPGLQVGFFGPRQRVKSYHSAGSSRRLRQQLLKAVF